MLTCTGGTGKSLSKLKAIFNSRNFGAFHISNGISCSLLFEISKIASDGKWNISVGIVTNRLSCTKSSSSTAQL